MLVLHMTHYSVNDDDDDDDDDNNNNNNIIIFLKTAMRNISRDTPAYPEFSDVISGIKRAAQYSDACCKIFVCS